MALKLRVNEVAERPMVAADADVAVVTWPTMARTMADMATVAQPAVRTLCFIFIFIPFVWPQKKWSGYRCLSAPAGFGRHGALAPRALVHDIATCARRSRPE